MPSPPSRRSAFLQHCKHLLLGLAVAAVFLALAEAALALAGVRPLSETADPFLGFAPGAPLYVEQADADGTPRMVTAPGKHQYFNVQRFPREKPPGTFRIFCLGGSTTYGNPYRDPTSFCGWLRELLPVADPSRRWEVINAGGISYASYRVAALMEELGQYAPDAYLIYTGQNEFLEQRSYGKLMDLPETLWRIAAWASHSRIFGLVHGAVGRSLPAPDAAQEPATGFAEVLPGEVNEVLSLTAGPKSYVRDDAAQQRVLRHFDFNLERMRQLAAAQGAKVLYVVPASNLSGVSPFKSEHRPGWNDGLQARWSEAMQAGERALAAGRAADAAAAFGAAVELDARYADAHFRLGRALEQSGRPRDALAAYERALREDVAPLRALPAIQDAVRGMAGRAPVYDFAAEVLRLAASGEHGKFGDSRGIPGNRLFLDHVHPTIAVNGHLATQLVSRMAQEGWLKPGADWNDAALSQVAARVEATVDRKAQADALQHLGTLLGWAGKFEEAHGHLQEALAHYGGRHARTLYLLGFSSERLGRPAEAERYYRQASEIDPGNQGAWAKWARVLRAQGRPEETIALARQRLQQFPEDAAAFDALGTASLDLGRMDEARTAIAQALRLAPENADVVGLWGNWLVAAGRRDEAIGIYRQALRHKPDHTGVLHNLGVLLLEGQRPDEAEPVFRALVAAKPDAEPAHFGLGVAQRQQGKADLALATWRRLLAINPRHADAHDALGLLLAERGARSEALAHFDAALRSDPGFAEARQHRAQLLGQAR